MMGHLGHPTDYAFPAHDDSAYDPGTDYYRYVRPQPQTSFYGPRQSFPDDPAALADALAGLEMAQAGRPRVNPSPNKEIVLQAIEAAAAALRDQASALQLQMSENERLKSALRVSEWELQNYKIDQGLKSRQHENLAQDNGPLQTSSPERHGLMQGYNAVPRVHWTGNGYSADPSTSLIVHPNVQSFPESPYIYPSNGVQGHHYGANISNPYAQPNNQQDVGFSQASSPTVRDAKKGEMDPNAQSGAPGNLHSRQELVPSVLKPQDDHKLRKHLIDTKSKELEYENSLLKKRIDELRLTIEKYQQDLVDMPKMVELLDENAKLKSKIRVVTEDNEFYKSSLTSLLAEYDFHVGTDPFSVVSGIKTLVQHFRGEGRRDMVPVQQQWYDTRVNLPPQVSSPSPVHPKSTPPWSPVRAPQSPERSGLAIVPQDPVMNNVHFDIPRPYERPDNNIGYQHRNDSQNNSDEDSNAMNVRIRDPRLPTLPEEASSDEEDPLPGIEGLQVNGEALLGNKISACGVSINGTTLCHFQWVRHNRDGSFFHIPGAAQPDYTITADDVDTLLSLECTPMDDRNRKGKMLQVFVNNRNRITLDNDMREEIHGFLESGLASFEVKLGVESSQDSPFEPATLTLKRSNYELRKSNGKKVLANERYASDSLVEIKVGKDSQCAIINNGGIIHLLDCDTNRSRDLLVLTMREFVRMAHDRKKPGGNLKRFWFQ